MELFPTLPKQYYHLYLNHEDCDIIQNNINPSNMNVILNALFDLWRIFQKALEQVK